MQVLLFYFIYDAIILQQNGGIDSATLAHIAIPIEGIRTVVGPPTAVNAVCGISAVTDSKEEISTLIVLTWAARRGRTYQCVCSSVDIAYCFRYKIQ